VFGFDYEEIAAAVGADPLPPRAKLAYRAREHVQSRRKRFGPVDPQRSMELTAQFLATAASGDVEALVAMLAPDVVWTADGGGKVNATRRPVTGAERVARLILRLMRFARRRGALSSQPSTTTRPN